MIARLHLELVQLVSKKFYKNTGEETIDLGTPKAGVPTQGVCGMGMFSFVVNYE